METLKELHIINSSIGLLHTIFAFLAMLLGSLVLLNKKGTKTHKRLGYSYIVCMLLVNISAFAIYNFDNFSMFHVFALISLITIAIGIIPAIQRTNNWLRRHFYFMSWSVVGLYCAFWAEIGVRLFDMKYFWWAVMLATMLTSLVGVIVINKQAKKLNF